MIFTHAVCLFLFLDKVLSSMAAPSYLAGTGPHGWRTPVDCVRASELCTNEQSCSSRYRTLRQCLAGRDRNTMLANKECQAALEVLQESPLYDCRCKRGMKKELQCLQIYWSIHLGLTEEYLHSRKELQNSGPIVASQWIGVEDKMVIDYDSNQEKKTDQQNMDSGEEFYEASPYEPVTSRLSDIFRLASIVSGMEPATSKSNHCLDAAKACNLNDNCKKLRSVYISTCSKSLSSSCNRRKCHKALRQFFDRVPNEYTYRLLFCSCKDPACAERRRQTIVPDCSYEEKEKPNCIDLRGVCRSDPLCRKIQGHLPIPNHQEKMFEIPRRTPERATSRTPQHLQEYEVSMRSRLADYHTNCQASFLTSSGCPTDNYQACLGSYAGLIGFDVTPNYVDASTGSITVSPWCTCKGSGNLEEECEKFVKDFTDNPCLRNAIQAFGNGTDVNMAPKHTLPPVTPPPKTEQSPLLPDDVNDSNTLYDNSVITPCAPVQEYGPKHNKSKEPGLCIAETQLTTDIMSYIDTKSHSVRPNAWRSLAAFLFILLKLAL